MDISAVGQSVEVVRKILEKAVAPGIDELRVDMKDVQSRMDRLETAVARRSMWKQYATRRGIASIIILARLVTNKAAANSRLVSVTQI